VPLPAPCRAHASVVQRRGDGAGRERTRRLYLAHDRQDVGRERGSLGPVCCMAQGARLGELGAAELLTLQRQSLLDNSERRFRSRADGLALVLGDGSEYMDRELVGVRHVGGDELDAGVQDRNYERSRGIWTNLLGGSKKNSEENSEK
jgi:hypothetical protein